LILLRLDLLYDTPAKREARSAKREAKVKHFTSYSPCYAPPSYRLPLPFGNYSEARGSNLFKETTNINNKIISKKRYFICSSYAAYLPRS
jgi:hypothetical protein